MRRPHYTAPLPAMAAATESNETPGPEVLSGGTIISEFLTGLLQREVRPAQVYTWARRGIIPTTMIGGILTTTKGACRRTLLGPLCED
jgi:hypothetical protein